MNTQTRKIKLKQWLESTTLTSAQTQEVQKKIQAETTDLQDTEFLEYIP